MAMLLSHELGPTPSHKRQGGKGTAKITQYEVFQPGLTGHSLGCPINRFLERYCTGSRANHEIDIFLP